MKRPLVWVLLCGALILAASVGIAVAQDTGRPQELWDEFPLEPSATPAGAEPRATATPTPEVVRVERREGTSTGALIALVLVAGAVGGIAARLAARRLPRARARAAATNGAPAAPASNGTPTERAAKGTPPAPASKGTAPGTPASDGTPRARAAKRTPPGAPAANGTPAAPASKGNAPGAPAANGTPASPSSKRRPARPATTDATPPEPASPPPPPARRAPRRRVRATPAAPKTRAPQPPPRPPSASPPKPPRTRRFEPAGAAWEACSIKLQMRDAHGRFCAIAEGEPPVVLAYSPTFALNRARNAPGPAAPAALKVLVEQLAAAGWRQAGTGKRPWELAFRRRAEAPRATRP